MKYFPISFLSSGLGTHKKIFHISFLSSSLGTHKKINYTHLCKYRFSFSGKMLIVILLMLICNVAISQTGFWNKSQRVTTGFVDKNPSFDTKRPYNWGTANFTFLIFERWSSLNTSNICVTKFGYDSSFGGVQYLTNNNKLNKNPKIAYKMVSSYGNTLTNAMAVWEVYENSRTNIYGATYNNNVWSAPYPIDTSSGNKANPYISYNSALSNYYLYSIVYEKDGDIIYKNYESVLNATWNEFNLTTSETENCRNPKVASDIALLLPHFVVFEKQKPNGDYGLYYKKSTTAYIWSGDTISTIGNIKGSYIANGSINTIGVAYESNKSGKWGLYATDYSNYYGTVSQSSLIVQSPMYNYRNVTNFLIANITDYTGGLNCYVRQAANSTKIMTAGSTFNSFIDSLTVGDSSSKTIITLGNGILSNINNYAIMIWMVFDKDSAGFSTLNARGKSFLLSGINLISTEIPSAFSLSQNYPNPFNAMTNVKFQIANSGNVKIKVFDILGKEVATLVNESLQPGTYETTFDASNLSSGIYFYQLRSDNFIQTKKLTLIR